MVPLPHAEVRVLGRYALYDEIASGGMATIHIGRLLGPVGFSRTVAIKRLHAQFAKDPDFVSMFLDEARLAARIRHPNVIGTLDVVALEGELFLVMEYVPGDSFARLWRASREKGQPIPLPIVSALLIGVLQGLHAAHEAVSDRGEPLGIVHRDVSPHNIIVGTDGIARVLDFGVAKATGRLQTTREGQLKGKISYMAPEQVQGTVDRTADIYAASVVLWEALTGRRLFFAENEARTLANVLYPHVEPPSRHARGISTRLDAVVLKGLSPSPAARFATAREMARALQIALPPAPASDVGDWVQSNAGATITMRAKRVATIERSTSEDAAFRPLQSPPTAFPVSQVSLRVRSANDPGELVPEMARVAASSAPPPELAPAPPRRRWRAYALAALLMVVLSSLAALALHTFEPHLLSTPAPTLAAAAPLAIGRPLVKEPAAMLTPLPAVSTRLAPEPEAPFPASSAPSHPEAAILAPRPSARPATLAPKRADAEFEHVLDSRK